MKSSVQNLGSDFKFRSKFPYYLFYVVEFKNDIGFAIKEAKKNEISLNKLVTNS